MGDQVDQAYIWKRSSRNKSGQCDIDHITYGCRSVYKYICANNIPNVPINTTRLYTCRKINDTRHMMLKFVYMWNLMLVEH